MTESPFDTGEPGRILRHAPAGKRPAWRRCFPGLVTLQHYNSSWLRHDLVAALVMTTMLVPVGVAYAEASGVPGRNGEAVNAYLASHPVEWVDREQREKS